MTRLPQVSARELIRFLKDHGFVEERQQGSHLLLIHPITNLTITIPVHQGRDLGRGLLVRTLKDAGFTSDDLITWKS